MAPILTRAEAEAEAAARAFPRGVSAEERLMALADSGRRLEVAVRAYDRALEAKDAALVMTDPAERPRPDGTGRVSIRAEVWEAMLALRGDAERLRAAARATATLAVSGDVEGR